MIEINLLIHGHRFLPSLFSSCSLFTLRILSQHLGVIVQLPSRNRRIPQSRTFQVHLVSVQIFQAFQILTGDIELGIGLKMINNITGNSLSDSDSQILRLRHRILPTYSPPLGIPSSESLCKAWGHPVGG